TDMDSPSSPAAATPPATGDDCFTMKKWQFKLRKPSPAIHPARRWRVVQSAEPQRHMRDRDAAIMSVAHRSHSHEPSRDAASPCSGSLNKTMCTQDVEQTVQGFSKLKEQPSELNVTWPEDLTFARLHIIVIKGFSGEPELMELLYFLLRRAPALESLQLETRAYEPFVFRKEKHKSEDEERCRYATEMASTHLAPKVPSTVAFSIT
uniref:FBD domain-containing protein n=1 Tax=Aegilops tauschii subsp. strangulata TaxID=200361 RepID=A0A453Q1P4_AEGTS